MRGRRRCQHETTDESELCLYFYLCEDQREFLGECALILRSEDTSCLDNDDMLKSVNSVWCSERLVSTDCLWYFSCMNKRCCPAGWCLRLLLRNTHAAFKCRQGKQDCKLKLSESRADRRRFPLFTQYFIQSTLFILLISFRRLSEPKSRRKWQKFVDSTVHSNSEEPEPSICLLMWGIKSL